MRIAIAQDCPDTAYAPGTMQYNLGEDALCGRNSGALIGADGLFRTQGLGRM
jgi:hypothetical protein